MNCDSNHKNFGHRTMKKIVGTLFDIIEILLRVGDKFFLFFFRENRFFFPLSLSVCVCFIVVCVICTFSPLIKSELLRSHYGLSTLCTRYDLSIQIFKYNVSRTYHTSLAYTSFFSNCISDMIECHECTNLPTMNYSLCK